MTELPESYCIPIHRALTQVILVGGVPRRMAILNGTITAALVFGLHSFWGGALGVLLHFVAVILTKIDPYFFEVAKRHLKHKAYYYGG